MGRTPEERSAWHSQRRQQIDAMKLERGCSDCGYDQHPAALQFDHRDPTAKAFAISGNLQRRWSVVLAEIEKCDVVCANCHAIRTAEAGYRGQAVQAL